MKCYLIADKLIVVYDSITENFFVHQVLKPNVLSTFFVVQKKEIFKLVCSFFQLKSCFLNFTFLKVIWLFYIQHHQNRFFNLNTMFNIYELYLHLSSTTGSFCKPVESWSRRATKTQRLLPHEERTTLSGEGEPLVTMSS